MWRFCLCGPPCIHTHNESILSSSCPHLERHVTTTPDGAYRCEPPFRPSKAIPTLTLRQRLSGEPSRGGAARNYGLVPTNPSSFVGIVPLKYPCGRTIFIGDGVGSTIFPFVKNCSSDKLVVLGTYLVGHHTCVQPPRRCDVGTLGSVFYVLTPHLKRFLGYFIQQLMKI